jgi:hypothetical protein
MKSSIELLTIPANFPPKFKGEDQRVFLDLGENFTFALSKSVTENNRVNKIKREGTESFSLPLTPKNKYIFRRWVYPNNFEMDLSPIKVIAWDGSHVLNEDEVQVLDVDLASQTIEIGLFQSAENSWIEGASNLFLTDVDFGTFTFTDANVQANWLEYEWNDDTDPYFYFGLIHWGSFITDINSALTEDFRPLLSIPGTLQKCFCELGWTFESPMMNIEWFRRLWWYGLGKEYYTYSGKGKNYRVDAETSADVVYASGTEAIVVFDQENYDAGGNYDNSTGYYQNVQVFDGPMTWKIQGTFEHPGGIINQLGFNIKVIEVSSGVELKNFNYSVGQGESIDVNIEFTEEFTPGIDLAVQISYLSIISKAGFSLQITPAGTHYYQDDDIEIRESIDPSYTFLQFLEGLAHFGYKFDTNYAERKVTMYPPENTTVFGTDVEGYFRPEYQAEDFSTRVAVNTMKASFPREDIPEKVIIGFKESADKWIEFQNIPEDNPLFSKTIMFENGAREVVEYDLNPFFEPTINFPWFGLNAPQIVTPAMWDNLESNRSFEIGPRILYAVGYVPQTETQDGVTVEKPWQYNGAIVNDMPYVIQTPEKIDFNLAGDIQSPEGTIGDPPTLPDKYITYDHPIYSDSGFWNTALKYDAVFYKNLPSYSVLVLINNNEYHGFSFRDRIWVEILGRPSIFKVSAIEDFQTEERIPTPFTLKIEPPNDC